MWAAIECVELLDFTSAEPGVNYNWKILTFNTGYELFFINIGTVDVGFSF